MSIPINCDFVSYKNKNIFITNDYKLTEQGENRFKDIKNSVLQIKIEIKNNQKIFNMDFVDFENGHLYFRIREDLFVELMSKDAFDSLTQGNIIIIKKIPALRYWTWPDDVFNKAESYFKPVNRSQYLFNLIKKYTTDVDSVFEIGCNVGRNLNYLYSNGIGTVGGCEISEHAVKLLNDRYPEISRQGKIRIGSAEVNLPMIADSEFDLVFTMAVLMHIHPESNIYPDIVRIARKYIITIENEESVSERNYMRNYKNIFEQYGFKEIFSEHPIPELIEDKNIYNYQTRVFEKT